MALIQSCQFFAPLVAHGLLSIEKSLLLRAAKLLKKFRLLSGFGLGELETSPETPRRKHLPRSHKLRQKELYSDILLKLERELWYKVFLIACEAEQFNEAAQLLSNSDIFSLPVS